MSDTTSTPSQQPASLKQVTRATRMKETALKNLFLACACVAVLAVILIFIFTFWKAIPVITQIGLGDFFSLSWAPTEGRYGILALLAGSGIVTVGSLALGVPLAVGCAVFLTEIAGKKLASVVSTAVDLLAGVPSVVYGFFGLVILRPIVAKLTGGLGFGALTVWLVLAIMIVPTITTLTMDALRSIPMGIREASFAMGATRWQTIYKVVLPAAKMGIVRKMSSMREDGRGRSKHRRAKAADRAAVAAAGISFDHPEDPAEHAPVQVLTGDDVTPVTGVVTEPREGSRARIKRLLAQGSSSAGGSNKNRTNYLMIGVFRAAGVIATAVLVLIIGFVAVNGLPVMSLDFIFGWPEGVNAEGGIFPTIVSTLYVTALAMLICVPIAVLAAVYLAEYAKQGRLVTFIRYAADTLSSVPSIVMGLFGYALFVEAMGFGLSMLSAALALALMMLPIVMRTTEEAIRSVPRYIRWGAYGLGSTKWQVVSKIVLPSAFPRIATGIVLAIGRAIGETAVVLYTMGQAINLPLTPLDSGRPITIHLYQLANEGINMQAAYGTALLLMVMILAFNLFARYLSRRSASKSKGN